MPDAKKGLPVQSEMVRLETAEKYLARALAAEEQIAAVEAVIEAWPDGEDSGERFGDPRGFYLGIAKRDIRKALGDAGTRALPPGGSDA